MMSNVLSEQNSKHIDLLNKKVAILLATGFEERDYNMFQKFFAGAGAHLKLVSTDQGLVTSWTDNGWGHNFAVDVPLNKALASDFAICVVPGGHRSLEKLVLSAHSSRFLNGFLASGKPVITVDEAAGFLSRIHVRESDVLEAMLNRSSDAEEAFRFVAVPNLTLYGIKTDGDTDFQEELCHITEHFASFKASKRAA